MFAGSNSLMTLPAAAPALELRPAASASLRRSRRRAPAGSFDCLGMQRFYSTAWATLGGEVEELRRTVGFKRSEKRMAEIEINVGQRKELRPCPKECACSQYTCCAPTHSLRAPRTA